MFRDWRLNSIMIKNKRLYCNVIEKTFGMTLTVIWEELAYNYSCFSYKERIDRFCFILEKAMNNGILKLAKDGVFLKDSVEKQVCTFKKSFPEKEEYIDELTFCYDKDDNFWIPGGAVWVNCKGEEIWT